MKNHSKMRDDFCAFILSHGRPDRLYTLKALEKSGYSGKWFIVIDDEDKTVDEYRRLYGDRVLQFCKREVAERLDEGDNSGKRISTIYARAAMFDLARQVGCRYFIQLDDDYTNFELRFKSDGTAFYTSVKKSLDDILEAMLNFFIETPTLSVAMSQGGDFVGGGKFSRCLRRKAMNTFICDVEKPFYFMGRMNEDVSTYVTESRRGKLFFTVMQAKIVQKVTQSNAGGMTELYLDSGTYVKTFYSVMYCPSSVQVSTLGDHRSPHYRIHHKINWHTTAPKILREEWKKPTMKRRGR